MKYPETMPCGKHIKRECRCPERNKKTSLASYTSPTSFIPDYVVMDYWCVNCYRRGIIKAWKKW